MTDVTGFGLAGHLLEICRGSRLGAELRFADLPVIDEARHWAQQGTVTGASARNWTGYGSEMSSARGRARLAARADYRSADQRRPAGGLLGG